MSISKHKLQTFVLLILLWVTLASHHLFLGLGFSKSSCQ